MKRTLCWITTCWLFLNVFVGIAFAAPISKQQALKNTQAFLAERGKRFEISSIRHAPSKSATAERYYVFNINDNAGFVIASGDDCAPAILGYADSGSVDVDSMPDNMKGWLEEYATQIEYMEKHGVNSFGIMKASSHTAISPLLTTTWNQLYPYNLNCPDFFDSGKCLTGCVATAMAQVLYYHRAKSVTATTNRIPAYVCSTDWANLGHIQVDEIPENSFIDWNNMLNSYTNSATTAQEQAVANLMRYCGATVKMEYATTSSFAFSRRVPPALKAYFNYDYKTELIYRNSYSSEEEWEDIICNELANKRPVYYAGSNSPTDGHAFVCDGYDGSGYFHINWGWGGMCDGYFLLTVLDPNEQGAGGSSSGYNSGQEAIINAQPRTSLPAIGAGISFADGLTKLLCLQHWDTNGDAALSEEEAAAVTDLGDVFNSSYDITTFNELQYFTGLQSISDNAFSVCKNLTSITIPSSVTSIGNNAFNSCWLLTSITIPSSVTNIGFGAFSHCSDLASITVNSNNSIYDSRNNCNAIIEKASNTLITGCKNTTIPSSVTSIGNRAFSGSSLTSITIPSSVTDIEGGAFSGSGLTSITIPSSVTYIGLDAFANCSDLASISVNSNNSIYDSRNNCNAIIEKASNTLITGCKNTTIPSSVTTIGPSAFSYSGLTSITIPSSVINIGSSAFAFCSDLASITFQSGLTNIGSRAFSNCYKLTSIAIPMSVTNIDNNAFGWCTNMSSVTVEWNEPLPIDENVFYNIGDITLYVPNRTKSAYEAANVWKDFKEIIEIGTITATSITLNQSTLSFNAANQTGTLTATVMPSNATNKNVTWTSSNTSVATVSNTGVVTAKAHGTATITATTTDGTNLTATCIVTVSIPGIINFADANVKALCVANWDTDGDGELSEAEAAAVTNLGTVFKNNTTITSFNELQYFTGLQSIADNAFNKCTNLTAVTLPSTITSIGSSAFDDCYALAAIDIPSSVTVINGGAFSDCRSLTSLVLPNGITNIGSWLCDNCTGLTEMVIPNSVTSIEQSAFQGCTNIETITLSENLTSIGNNAFDGCKILASVVIPDGVTSIGDASFRQCNNLTTLVIPNSVTSIGSYAFQWCSGLTSITIPSSVTSIGEYAFSHCTGFTSVTVGMTTPLEIITDVDNRANATLIVPLGRKEVYESANYWKDFKQIVEMGIATGITLNQSTLSFDTADQTATLTATVTPEDAKDKSVTWTSSDTNVATVDENGVVTAIANGTATITAKTNDGSNLSATCAVTVAIQPGFFSNNTLYTLTCKRGGMVMNAEGTGLAAGQTRKDAPEADKRFAIITYDGAQYLYSPTAKQYLRFDGSFVSRLGTPINFDDTHADGAYEYMLSTKNENGETLYFNNNGEIVINSWDTPDDGNRWLIEPVADFDPTEALALAGKQTYTVTYEVQFDGQVVATATEKAGIGDALPATPASLNNDYIALEKSGTHPSTVTEDVTVAFTAMWNGPFQFSKSVADAKWYNMHIRSGYYIGKQNSEPYYPQQNAGDALKTDAYHWAFGGDPYHVKVYNRTTGFSETLTKDGDNAVMRAGDYTWDLLPNADGFVLRETGTSYNCVNQFGGNTGPLQFWDSTGSPTDNGSTFRVEEAQELSVGIGTMNREPITVNQPIYNLNGQRLTKPQRGVNIVNGKKVAIK